MRQTTRTTRRPTRPVNAEVRRRVSLILARREAEVETVRREALAQGFSRFPLDGRGPTMADRYEWPTRTTADLMRTCRQTPIIRRTHATNAPTLLGRATTALSSLRARLRPAPLREHDAVRLLSSGLRAAMDRGGD